MERAAFTCGSCAKRYDEAAWEALALVERIESPDLRRFVSTWPEGTCVEARRCAHCGQSIAAKRPARRSP
jgi:hypothetical protein